MDPTTDTGAQTTFPQMHWAPLSRCHAGLLELWHMRKGREHVSAAVQMRPQQCSSPQVITTLPLVQISGLNLIHWHVQNKAFHDKVVFELLSQHRKKNKYLKNSLGTDILFPLAPRDQTTTQSECKNTLTPTLPSLIVYSPILITLALFSTPWIFFFFWLLSLTHNLLSFLFLTLLYLILLFQFLHILPYPVDSSCLLGRGWPASSRHRGAQLFHLWADGVSLGINSWFGKICIRNSWTGFITTCKEKVCQVFCQGLLPV